MLKTGTRVSALLDGGQFQHIQSCAPQMYVVLEPLLLLGFMILYPMKMKTNQQPNPTGYRRERSVFPHSGVSSSIVSQSNWHVYAVSQGVILIIPVTGRDAMYTFAKNHGTGTHRNANAAIPLGHIKNTSAYSNVALIKVCS